MNTIKQDIKLGITTKRTLPISDEQAKAELKREFPGWNIICSSEGRWWGQRFPLTREQFNRVNMVDADTCEALRAALTAVTS